MELKSPNKPAFVSCNWPFWIVRTLCNWIVSLFVFIFPLLPVPDEVITSHGAIEADKENVRQEPYSLPQGFMWDTLDLGNAEVVSKTLDLGPRVGMGCFCAGPKHHRQDACLVS